MNVRGWFSIALYSTVGFSLLSVIGWGVYEFANVKAPRLEVSVSKAKAQSEALPPPEDISIEPPQVTEPTESAESINPSETTQVTTEQPSAVEQTGSRLGILEGIIEDYDYNGQEKRDPFAPYSVYVPQTASAPLVAPSSKLETYEIDQLRLVGVIWDVSKPKALIITPSNETYVIYNNTRIGKNNGKVASIREGEIVVVEAFYNNGKYSYQPKLLKLQTLKE